MSKVFVSVFREVVEEIDSLYAERNCQEAISVSRMLLATLQSDEINWKELRNGACGVFFR